MNAALAMWSLGVLVFGGWGIGYLLPGRQKSFCDLAVNAWLLGGILVSVSLGVFGTVLSGTSLIGLVTIVCFLPGLMALRKMGSESGSAFTWPWPKGALEWGLCGVIALQCAMLARFAWTRDIGWDGLMVWEVKARIAFGNGGKLPVAYFCDTTRWWSHPNYPLMLPLIETWVYSWMGECNECWVRMIFPIYYLTALMLLYSGAAWVSGKRWVGLLTASLLFFVPFVTVREYNAFSGYADFPLGVYYLAAVVYLIRSTREPGDTGLALFAIYAGALPWMKQEGTYLWLFVLLVAGVELVRQGKMRLVPLAALPGLVTIGGWKIALVLLKALESHDYLPVTRANLMNNASRMGTIVEYLGTELSRIRSWSLLWIMLPVALLWVGVIEGRRMGLQLAGVILMPIGFYSCIYILSTWEPYITHVECSLPRLISGVSLVAVLTLGAAISAMVKTKREEKGAAD